MREHFDRRAAAHRALDAWFTCHGASLDAEQAAEADRYSRMKRDQDAGARRALAGISTQAILRTPNVTGRRCTLATFGDLLFAARN